MRAVAKLAALAAIVIAVTATTDDRFLLRVITLTLIWAAAGVAWNLVAKAGQISLAHSAFVGVGAYTFTILLRNERAISPWIGMLAGMVLAMALAVIIGLPTFRLKGFYFTLATLSFPLILELLVAYFGSPEMTVPYRPDGGWPYLEFSDAATYIWVLLAMLLLYLIVTMVIDRAPFGFALAATRDNEVLARAVGLRTSAWKMAALVISAAMAAAVGVLWVKSVLRVTTAEETFSIEIVVVMLSVTAVGGVGRTWGPVIGSAIITPLALSLDRWVGASIPGIEEIVYGVVLVLVAVFFPDGVLSLVDRFRRTADKNMTLSIMPHRGTEAAATAPRPSTETLAPEAAALQPTDSVPLLEVAGIAKNFGAVKVLTDVNFSVAAGQRLGLIGPNGAGKTTLFNILTAHLRADQGQVRYLGEDIGSLPAPARYQLGISRTFQVPQGFHRLTVRDNVVVAALGAQVADPIGAAAASLERVGLDDRIDADLAELTVAETKFLELARAIVAHPKVLLLDEPLAGLNEAERRRFFSTVDTVAGADVGVVVIEHSVKSLASFVDEFVALDHGVVIAAGRPSEVIKDERVIEAYLGTRWRAHAENS